MSNFKNYNNFNNSNPNGNFGGAPQQPYGAPQQPYGAPQGQPGQPAQPGQQMTFMESIDICFKKYADFNGRASRAEFWWWILFTFICSAVLTPVSEYVAGLFQLVVLVPTLAVSWRRLHDIGRAGGFFFIGLIPLVGWIFVLIWYATPTQPFQNRFGFPPVK